MGGEWSETTLGDLIDIKHGFAFKGQFIYDEPRGDLLLTPGNFAVRGGFKGDKFKYYDGPVSEEFVLRKGDLLITMTDLSKQSDTLGYPAFVPAYSDGRRCLHNQRLGKVTPKETADIDLRYIYYVMCGKEYRQEVLASATGTTVKHTSPERLRRFRFLIPPLPEQRAIAHILGTLDDKIELNRRMNETLEAMARALFKDWFVDFGPTRAKIEGYDPYLAPEIWDLFPDKLDEDGIPEGWSYRPVSAFSKIKGGKQLTKHNFVESGPHPVFGGAGIMGYTDQSNADGFVISVGRVGAYCGQFFSFRGKAWINNNASQISPFEAVSGEWLLLNLRALDIDLIKKGAAQPFVSNSDIAAMKIIDPGEKVLESFHELIAPLAAGQENNDRENSILSSMRNLLLPGLMSGEIRVGDADKIVKEFT